MGENTENLMCEIASLSARVSILEGDVLALEGEKGPLAVTNDEVNEIISFADLNLSAFDVREISTLKAEISCDKCNDDIAKARQCLNNLLADVGHDRELAARLCMMVLGRSDDV